mgnify:CR=1 FL=1
MPRTSKVRRLPPELREQLHAMLDAGHTLEEITAHLKALGADVSRSGLGRYKQQVDKEAARLRESRAMAEAVMERMGAQAATGKSGATVEGAAKLGTIVGKLAQENGVTEVVFDRGGHLYHGRVKALAEAAREAGLKF